MRYITEAEKKSAQQRARDRAERLRWMTLVDAVKNYKDRQHCGNCEAVEDLLCLIVDGRIRALSGDTSYRDNTLSGYHLLSPSDLKREVKVCLDGPGFIDLLSSKAAETEYPKVSIVKGRISKVGYDKSYPFSPPALPIADELQYGPVLVSCDDFEKWLSAQQEEPPEGGASSSQVTGSSVPDATSTSRRQRGRRLGTGSWAGADDPLLARMRELIEAGIAKSANDAAGQLAGEARGAGTIDSKRHRLGKRYRARYSLE